MWSFIKSLFTKIIDRDDLFEVINDISKWQCTSDDSKLFDFNVYESSDSHFLIVKASQGTYSDRRYSYYIDNITKRKLPFGTYHYADTKYSAKESAEYYANQINLLPEETEPIYVKTAKKFLYIKSSKEVTRHWLDVENSGFRNKTKQEGKEWVLAFINRFNELTDVKLGIYTSYYHWKDNINPITNIGKLDLWIAHYDYLDSNGNLVQPKTPKLPNEWKKYLLWQTCDSCVVCSGCGKKYGAASISIDMDKFGGVKEDFLNWLYTCEENEMPTDEYYELLEMINNNSDRIAALEGGNPEPPTDFINEMIVTANPSLRLRETPETGEIIINMPYDSLLMASELKIPDSYGNGYWVYVKYLTYEGWTAEWYLKKS